MAKLPSITFVLSASKIEECGLPRKSTETSGSSQYARMPFSGPSAAAFIAALIASASVDFVELDREVDRPRRPAVGHAHRVAVELALERGQHEADRASRRRCWSGSSRARPRARGAGPCAGSRAAPGRWCRRGSWSSSRSRCRTSSFSTFATGARQFVVHDAFDTMLVLARVVGRRRSRRARSSRRGPSAGAVMITRSAPASRCFAAPSRVGEDAGRLDHDACAPQLLPRELGRVALGADRDALAVDHERVLLGRAPRPGSGRGSSRT